MKFREWLLSENKQEIIALGFPKVIADILYENFGKNAFQIAKWNKDYSGFKDKENWWIMTNSSYSMRTLGLADYVRLYEGTKDVESFKKAFYHVYEKEPKIEEYELEEQRDFFKKRIEEDLLNSTFFDYLTLIKDVKDGKLTDLAPYKKLSYQQAQDKYDKKQIFKDVSPIKVYENGWKWINVGKKCHLIGDKMKNCGSAGVMSSDEDRTIIVLFDKGNKPHVIVTYSPNQKRISGEEGIAGSLVKDKYSNYVVDLEDILGAKIDKQKTKNKILKLKSFFKDSLKDIKRLGKILKYDYNEYFLVELKNGEKYYSNGELYLSEKDIELIKNKYGFDYKKAFDWRNREKIESENNIQYKSLNL